MTAPLKNLARELYRIRRDTEGLESRLRTAAGKEKVSLEDALRKARAERDRLNKILQGQKAPPTCRKPF